MTLKPPIQDMRTALKAAGFGHLCWRHKGRYYSAPVETAPVQRVIEFFINMPLSKES